MNKEMERIVDLEEQVSILRSNVMDLEGAIKYLERKILKIEDKMTKK